MLFNSDTFVGSSNNISSKTFLAAVKCFDLVSLIPSSIFQSRAAPSGRIVLESFTETVKTSVGFTGADLRKFITPSNTSANIGSPIFHRVGISLNFSFKFKRKISPCQTASPLNNGQGYRQSPTVSLSAE